MLHFDQSAADGRESDGSFTIQGSLNSKKSEDIKGGVIFMWLEKPHEEEVCKELSDNYAKLHELQKHSEQMMNRSRYFS